MDTQFYLESNFCYTATKRTATFVHINNLQMRSWEEFQQSLQDNMPPIMFDPYLKAMWYDGKDQWANAHDTIEKLEDNKASWIHAYLHRKEGDKSNARYWYRKAKKEMPGYSLDQERKEIVNALL